MTKEEFWEKWKPKDCEPELKEMMYQDLHDVLIYILDDAIGLARQTK